MGLTTGFRNSAGKDIGSDLVEKSYLIDRYPELADTFRFAGLWSWGNNGFYGQLGDNTTTHRSSPIQTIAGGTNWKQVRSGGSHTAAIKTDGTLWLWGNNLYGNLGRSDVTPRSSPIQTISGGTNWKQVACGKRNFTAAIKTDGTLWLWGKNSNYGQLGRNDLTDRSSPIQTVSGGTNWKQVACGFLNTAAIKTDGTLWLWGYNSYGNLGNNSPTSRSSPVQTVAGGTNWSLVTMGDYNTAAIKTDGTLWLWGKNNWGQLGDNATYTAISSPIQTVSGGTNWKQVSAGRNFTAAVKTDGTLWLWGRNSYGPLGDNIGGNAYSSPIQTISGGTNWKQVDTGENETAAIKTDGTLWTWGKGGDGRLGNNTTTDVSSPIQTVSAGTNWKQVAVGSVGSVMVAIRDDSSDLFGDPV